MLSGVSVQTHHAGTGSQRDSLFTSTRFAFHKISCMLFVSGDPDVNECTSNPCMNGGTCNNLINSYTCTCPRGYSGSRCQTSVPCMDDSHCDSSTSYCRHECVPASGLPTATSLLDVAQRHLDKVPTTFDGELCVLVEPQDQPRLTNTMTLFTRVRQELGNDGYVLLRGNEPPYQNLGLRLRSGDKAFFYVSHWKNERTVSSKSEL